MSRSRKATGGTGTATPGMPEGAAPPGFPRAGARRMNIDEYYIRMEAAALPRAPGREAGSYGGLPCGTHGTADGGGDVADDCAGIPGWGSDKSRYGSSGRCRGDGACLPVAGLSRPGRARGRGSGCRAPVPATGRGRARTPCFRDFLWVFTSYFCTDIPVYLIKKFDFF